MIVPVVIAVTVGTVVAGRAEIGRYASRCGLGGGCHGERSRPGRLVSGWT
jgi:hypothetical protein